MRGRRFVARLFVLGAMLALPSVALASPAVVLVSGFDTATPFTTPAASCAPLAGPTWGAATGPAASLRAAGEAVFTAPIANAGASPGPPCTGSGGAVPPSQDVINSNGDVNANGAALMGFLQFLATHYGVTSVSLVGHSDGGLWSRSAISQLRAANAEPAVQSLTTLGTPHTGSFGADLAEQVVNGECEFSNRAEQLVCQALLSVIQRALNGLGPMALSELTSSFLAGWNPEQTIGCPVSVAAGTFVKVPYIGFLLPRYYNPNDGIVGQASALGQASTSLEGTTIPGPGFNPVSLGSFPVVHSSTLTFLGTDHTLTSDPAVGAAVVSAVLAGANKPTCSAPVLGVTPSRPRASTVRVRRGFTTLDLARRAGRTSRSSGPRVAFLLRGAWISCRGRLLQGVPMLGSRQVRIAVVRCAKGRVQVHGRVLFLRRDPQQRTLVLTRRGRRLSARVRGPALSGLRISVRIRGQSRLLHGRVIRLPAATGAVTVRAAGVDRSGERWLATAVVSS